MNDHEIFKFAGKGHLNDEYVIAWSLKDAIDIIEKKYPSWEYTSIEVISRYAHTYENN